MIHNEILWAEIGFDYCNQLFELEKAFGSVKKFVSLEENDSFLVRITI